MIRHPFALRLLALFSFVAACGDDAPSSDADVASDGASDTSPGDTPPDTTPDTLPDVVAPVTCEARGTSSLRLVQDGTRLRDADGRVVTLHGVNAGGRAKFPPFVPFAFDAIDASAPPFDAALADYFERVRLWGLDVVRLPFTWEAVEPVRGEYDATFLARLDAMVDAASARGIRVILDNHQDVFARRYCGDGFPLWALGNPDAATPADCAQWFLGYFQNADVRSDFDRFWANDDGLRDAFEAMWTMMATRYRDEDGVIGYEIINEPGAGTHAVEDFGANILTPFFTRMVTVIRAVSSDQLVFIDATGLDGVSDGTSLTRPVGTGLVFAPHFYDGLALAGSLAPEPGVVTERLAAWRDVGRAWDVPVMIGEFGAPHQLDGVEAFVREHWDAFDALGLHGTQWEYSVTGETWNAESLSVVESDGSERPVAAELVRAYPAAVAGALVAWHYDATTFAADLTLDADGVSIVCAPARNYPQGPAVTVLSGEACTRWDADREELLIGARGAVHVTFGRR